jgi:hypothetical protein
MLTQTLAAAAAAVIFARSGGLRFQQIPVLKLDRK